MRRKKRVQARMDVGQRAAGVMAAVSGGAVAQYFLDRAQGRTRRARVADKVGAALRRPADKAADKTAKKTKVVRDKAVGSARGVVTGGEPPPNDQTLVDKIRSEVFGADEFSAYDIHADAAGGNVALRGQVTHPEEIKALERAVRQVPGVEDVSNFVHLPGTDPKNIRGPLEASRGRGRRPS